MTDEQSLKDIRSLLLKYPGVTSAVVFRVPDKNEIHIRFRCTDAASLRAIAASAVWANVVITLGNPNTSICAEPRGVTDLPCDVSIPDGEADTPTQPERFGVYISDNLEEQGLISLDESSRLHARWNTRLTKRWWPDNPGGYSSVNGL